MARPKSDNPMLPMASRAPASTIEAVKLVSSAKGLTESELIRMFVEDGLRKHIKTLARDMELQHDAEKNRVQSLLNGTQAS